MRDRTVIGLTVVAGLLTLLTLLTLPALFLLSMAAFSSDGCLSIAGIGICVP